ncbi:MAG: hypothetical protein U1E52_03895 [Geminicoccaceae bacterium]
MSKIKIFAVAMLGAAVAFPSLGWADGPPPPPSAPPAATIGPAKGSEAQRAAARVANKSIILCYTCGGNYSHKVGEKDLGGYNWVWEYGSGCRGGLAWRWDRNPYFCAH